MILKLKALQDASNKILTAVDSDVSSVVNETLELVTKDNQLWLNVTNKEYYSRVKIEDVESEDFRAVVEAKLFLNLISKLTTEDIELTVTETTLVIKANGSYKLPLIYDGNSLLVLPEIAINNVTSEFNISSDILLSVLAYNSKELVKNEVVRPVQRLYYVDEKGCITFTNSACVNSFTLEKPVKLLLNQKLVKLFKLFKDGDVKFTLGYDQLGQIIQTKVRFETNSVSITAITSTNDSLLSTVPAETIRERAFASYPHKLEINRVELQQALARLMLFNTSRGGNYKDFGTLEFDSNGVTIYDSNKTNKETVGSYNSDDSLSVKYTTAVDINNLKNVLDGCQEDVITFSFGNRQCVVISRGNIRNVIPEAYEQ